MEPNTTLPPAPAPDLNPSPNPTSSPTSPEPLAPNLQTETPADFPPPADGNPFKAPEPLVAPVQHTTPEVIAQELAKAQPVAEPTATPPVVGDPVVGNFVPQPVAPPTQGQFSQAPSDPYDGSPSPAAMPMPAGPKRRLPKSLLVAVVAVLVLGIGTAAAYVGVIVPNQPANILKKSIENSLQIQQANVSGSFDIGGQGLAAKASFTGSADTAAKAADINLNLTISGVSVPFETRYVDKNLYLKVGDLGNVTSLLNGLDPTYGSVVSNLNKQIANKWVVIDSTLLDQAGAGCVLNTNWTLSQADIRLIESQYNKHPFTTIKSVSADTVGGKKVQKFVLSIDDDKSSDFTSSLGGLSAIKNLSKCQGSSKNTSFVANKDHDQTPVTVWVDKGTKRIVQIASQSTAKDAKNGVRGDFTMKLDYDTPVKISAPSNALPAIQFLSSLTGLSGNLSAPTASLPPATASSSNSAKDAQRQSDLAALQTQLEAAFSQNGNYPSLTQVNDPGWRQANMPSFDTATLKDPDGTSSTLAAKPAPKVYAYQVTNDSGGSCEANQSQCTKYTLTAILSNGTAYTKNNVD